MAVIDSVKVGSTTYDIAAKKLSGAVTVDGVAFDGSTSIVHYGVCNTGPGTTTKAVDCPGFSLVTGAKIAVEFTYGNVANNPYLNVNNTEAISIVKYGTTGNVAYMWRDGEIVEFVYDGTRYVMVKGGVASTIYYGVTKLSDSTSSTSTDLAATANAVKKAYDLANGKVTAVAGKGLSTNDYTTDEKNKLAGIATGAQVNSITGVKGNSETSYRTGNVNLTAANIGAAASSAALMNRGWFPNGTSMLTVEPGYYQTSPSNLPSQTFPSGINSYGELLVMPAGYTHIIYISVLKDILYWGSNANTWTILQYQGKVPIANGGTGLTASPSMLTNLASTTAVNVLQASPRPGVTGTLPITNGGTGAASAAAALTALGAVGTAAKSMSNLDHCDLSGFYIISKSNANTNHKINNSLAVLHIKYNDNTAGQLAFGLSTDALYYRRKNSGSWQAWRPLTLGTAVSTSAASSLMSAALGDDALDVLGEETLKGGELGEETPKGGKTANLDVMEDESI